MRKILTVFLLILALCFITSCDQLNGILNKNEENNNVLDQGSEYPEIVYTTYMQAQEMGYEGTLEEFLQLVQGADGKDGCGIENVTLNEGILNIYLSDKTVITLGPITGVDGNDGKDGQDGVGIAKVEIDENGHLLLYYTNDAETAIDLGKVVGTDGINGTNGIDGVDGIGIVKTEIDANGHLIIYYTNAPDQGIDLGQVVPEVESNSSFCAHNYSDWLTGRPATCTSMGFDSRVCSDCNDLDYQFSAPLGHNSTPLAGMLNNAGKIVGVYCCETCGTLTMNVVDPNGDEDADGITNAEEIALGTNIFSTDSDSDGLLDNEELVLGTNPAKADTDGDGVSDGREVAMGFNPLVPESSFTVSAPIVTDNEETPDIVTPTLNVELTGEQLESLVVERDDFFDTDTLGYMGDAYNYEVEGDITAATVGFEFDTSRLNSNSLPTIYAYNRQAKTMTPLETNISGNVATAEVNELSTFVLLDRRLYETELKWVDNWGNGSTTGYTNIELVFVIDDSGSMSSNDSSYKCLEVARNVVDTMGENASIGIVRFSGGVNVLTSSLVKADDTGKASLKNILKQGNNFYHSGLTYLYTAITSAAGLYSTPAENDTTYRVMIVLSDGLPEGESTSQATAVNAANAKDIEVYTVGLGTNTSYFNNSLIPVANATGGTYQNASNTSALMALYDKIRTTIDLYLDSDNDGLADYYEDNMVSFGNMSFAPDKNNPDTDGDGLLDGEEIETVIILSTDGTKLTVMGKVHSDPTKADTDEDGWPDKFDADPLDPKVQR